MSIGAGHKFLLCTTSSAITIYLSSIPGIKATDYSKFSSDNFFYLLDEFGWSGYQRDSQVDCSGGGHFRDSGYNGSLTPAEIVYDPENGSISFTPCKIWCKGYGGSCSYCSHEGTKFLKTKLFFIK